MIFNSHGKHILTLSIFVLFLLSGVSNSFSQRAFYSTDTLHISGANIQDKGPILNALFCHLVQGGEVLALPPGEVLEYGLADGRVYHARTIEINNQATNVFLELIYSGQTSLYYFRNATESIFFLQSPEGELTPAKRTAADEGHSYRQILSEISASCPQQQQYTPLVRFNKGDMALFMKRVEQCSEAPFPFVRIGITGFAAFERLSPSKEQETAYLNLLDFPLKFVPQIGVFINVPLIRSSFSLQTELVYSRSNTSILQDIRNNAGFVTEVAEFSLERSRITTPILIRYTLPRASLRPYINLGPVFQLNLSNSYKLNRTPQPGQPIPIPFEFPDLQTGFAGGLGIEYSISHRAVFTVEWRYNLLINPSNFNDLRETQTGIVIGRNF